MIRRALAATAVLALSVTACSGGDGSGDVDPAAAPTTGAPTSTAPPEFEGDPDSEFCQRSREAAEEPVLDPFAAGLDAREVELRFRALAQRFEGFAEIAPEPLVEDLTLLDGAFQDLAVLLEEADYDFAELAEQGADISVFDDPALGAVAKRLAAYQDQVCSD